LLASKLARALLGARTDSPRHEDGPGRRLESLELSGLYFRRHQEAEANGCSFDRIEPVLHDLRHDSDDDGGAGVELALGRGWEQRGPQA
jgi:hypothetical protein